METNRPDELNPSFLEQLAALSQKYSKAILGFLVLLIVIGASLLINSYYTEMYESKAAEELFKAEVLHNANLAMKRSVGDLKKEGESVTVDVTQVAEKLNHVIQEYPKSTAALQAAITLSDLYYEKKETQKALDVLESSIKNNSSNKSVIAQSLRLKLSNYLERSGDCQKALDTLKPVTDTKNSFFKPEALLRSGLCYESLGNNDKAKEVYQKLATEHLDTNQGQQAQKYLKLLGA